MHFDFLPCSAGVVPTAVMSFEHAPVNCPVREADMALARTFTHQGEADYFISDASAAGKAEQLDATAPVVKR